MFVAAFLCTYLKKLLLLLPGDTTLQQLCTGSLDLLLQLLFEKRNLQSLSFGSLHGLHVSRVQQHLLLVLILGLGRKFGLLLTVQDGLLLLGGRNGCSLQDTLVLCLQAAQRLSQLAQLR